MYFTQDMIIGLEDVEASNLYGMPRAHLEIIARTAAKFDAVIAFRGVHPLSKSLIEDEILPTKPFGYYAKTAQFGPCTNLVAVNPKHSRAKTDTERDAHQQDIQDALKKPNCEIMQALLSRDRLHELAAFFGDKFRLVPIPGSIPEQFEILWQDDDPDSRTRKSIARYDASSGQFRLWDIEQIGREIKEIPTMVLGYRVKGILFQLGTDYDLAFLGISFRVVDFQHTDKTPVRTQGPRDRIERELELFPEDKDGGNWSPRIKMIVQELNKAFAEQNPERLDKPLVHHNADLNNPFSKSLESHLPCLVALPMPMDLSSMREFVSNAAKHEKLKSVSMVLLTSVDQYVMLHGLIKSVGYYLPTHHKHRRLSSSLSHIAMAAEAAIAAMKRQLEEKDASFSGRPGSLSVSTTVDSFMIDSDTASSGADDTDPEEGALASHDKLIASSLRKSPDSDSDSESGRGRGSSHGENGHDESRTSKLRTAGFFSIHQHQDVPPAHVQAQPLEAEIRNPAASAAKAMLPASFGKPNPHQG